MSAVGGSMTILRAAAVLGGPVSIGAGRADDPREVDLAQTGADADAFDAGYANGLEQGRAAGFAQGQAEGFRSGREEGVQSAAGVVQSELEQARQQLAAEVAGDRARIADSIASLAQAHRQLRAGAEDALAVLGLELACKVLGPALANVEGVRAQVRLLLRGSHGPVTVHVHPSMADELAAHPCDDVRWVADEAVPLGGARLQDGTTSIDARTETILGNFKDVLLRSLAAASPPSGEESAS